MESWEAVTHLVHDLLSAWNRGDASAFAALFTADAVYVTGAGVVLHGRQAIAELLRTAVSPPRVRVEGEISVRDYGAVSTVLFRWQTESGIEPRRSGIATCLLVQRGAEWLIERLHNTDEA